MLDRSRVWESSTADKKGREVEGETRTIPCRQLPDGRPISAFGFGCSSYWARPAFPPEDAVNLVLRAHELGINHFDTGPSYAAGEAERRLGTALRLIDRSQLVISTKAGTFPKPDGTMFKSFDPSQLRDSIEGSLSRVGIDHFDIVYLHGPSTSDLSRTVIEFLLRLKADGLTRYCGVNSFDRSVLKLLPGLPIDVVMPQYNVFDITCFQEIEAIKRAGKIVISATALGQGIFDLTSLIPSSKKSLWYLLRALKNDPVFPITRLRARQRISSLGRTPLEASLAFILKTPAITSAVFGTTSTSHLEQNIRLASQIAALD